MASSSALCFSPFSPTLRAPLRLSHGVVRFSSTLVSFKTSLTSSPSSFPSPLTPRTNLPPSQSPSQTPSSLTVFAAKGYKMKTHKASAKRFRVTGSGKIVRRRSGKQHLLGKKNTKRKLRLSKMHPVNRSDYDNVIGALPYLKVNRKAT
ncbi:50S ribosomal protein L35, chloroplastic [Ananas comosus]|uniref:50S ribosomal protein L35 n=1 Tax=Ananas comosus TaxID=4615 RepID=A0A199VVD9_ANACO|nr:50S ribosomal protein L35, chloroplastic [Ananas comosus]